MTGVAILVVALTVAAMLLYALPVANERLEGHDLDRLTARAAQTADAIAEGEGRDLGRSLGLAAEPDEREALFVGPNGRVAQRAGPRLLGDDPGAEAEALREAAAGGRVFREAGGLDVVVTPVYYGGELQGGVVLASRGTEGGVFGFFLRSSVEAAMLASALGGGLVLLLASLLSRRVERIADGARAIERGDLSRRIEPGFGDELGQLARAFNSMAERLQDSLSRLEERVVERTAELEAERARLEAVLRQMPSGVVVAEAPSGRVVLSNERAGRIRGRPLPAYVGSREHKDGYEVFHPDGRPYAPEEWPLARTVRTGEEVQGEEVVVARGDGSRATVRVNSSPILGPDVGRVVAGVAVFQDVTEQKRAEEEIRRLNEGLERRVRERTAELERERRTLDVVLANLSEGVMAVDAEGRVVFSNPAARSMMGTDGGGLPEGVPDPWGDFDLPLAVARVVGGHEGVVARVGGARSPLLEVHLEPLPGDAEGGAEGGANGVLVVARDLSEGLRLEERQQRFLADAAHELKTPLTAILGAAELLLDGEDEDTGADAETRRRLLGHVHSQALRMRRLSEALLRLARTGADLREPGLREVPMGFLGEVAERAEPLVGGAGLELIVDDRGGTVLADPEWLEQALLILVSNAAKHSGRGGRVWMRVDGGTIEVADEGEGISEEDLRRVFERHYRGGPGGFGLGLPICKELVERMGGTISVESEGGVGTTARIRLPEVAPDE